jgi:hypothetical protein
MECSYCKSNDFTKIHTYNKQTKVYERDGIGTAGTMYFKVDVFLCRKCNKNFENVELQ